MGQSKLLGGGTSNIVNGIIEEYYAATEDVSANTFVEFISKTEMVAAASQKTLVESGTYGPVVRVSAAALSDTKVFVAFSVNVNTYRLYALICTVNTQTNTVTPGTVVNVSSDTAAAEIISVVALTSSKVALVYSGSATRTLAMIRCRICTISGTTITMGTQQQLQPSNQFWGAGKAVKLTDSSFLLTGCASSSSAASITLQAAVCTVSGTTVTVGSFTTITSDEEQAVDTYEMIEISSTKVLLAISKKSSANSSYKSTYVIILTVSGTTVTKGSWYEQKSNISYTQYIKLVKLSQTKAVLFYGGAYYQYACVVTISGTSVSYGTSVYLQSKLSNYLDLYAAAYTTEYCIILTRESGSSGYSASMTVLTISDKTITVNKKVSIGPHLCEYNYDVSIVPYENSRKAIIFAGDAPTNTSTVNLIQQVDDIEIYAGITPLTASSKFLGLTRNKATTTKKGKVWVLKGE